MVWETKYTIHKSKFFLSFFSNDFENNDHLKRCFVDLHHIEIKLLNEANLKIK